MHQAHILMHVVMRMTVMTLLTLIQMHAMMQAVDSMLMALSLALSRSNDLSCPMHCTIGQ